MSFINKKIVDGANVRELEHEVVGTGKGATFGILGANNSGIALHNQLTERHILAIGAIGSGKSNILYHMIDALRENANEDDMFIFFDAKGDYLEEFYREGDYVISNAINSPRGTVYWNIYEEIMATHPEKRDELIKEISTGIFREDIEKSSAPIFALGARDLFAAILSAQIKEIEQGAPMMDHTKMVDFFRKATDVTMRNLLLDHEELKWVRMYIKKENPSQTQSFLVHLYQTVYKIFSGAFEKEGNFSIRKAIKQKNKKAVFLEYDLSAGYILEDIYTLLLDISMKEVLGRDSNGGKNGRVFFVLDEFPLM